MTLSKAAELLALSAHSGIIIHGPDLREAQKLGAEAIKRLQSYRQSRIAIAIMKLPGETF